MTLSPRSGRARSARGLAPVLTLLSWSALVGCSGGGNGGGTIPANGAPPAIDAIVIPNNAVGAVPLQVTISDAEADPIELRVDVSTDGGLTWRTARFVGAPDLSALPSSPTGVTHTLTWDTVADLGFRTPVAVRIRVSIADVANATNRVESELDLTTPIDNLAIAAERVATHMIHYGPLDPSTMVIAKRHDLVVVHTAAGSVTFGQVRELQAGADPADPSDDVIVLAYLSIGEDLRTTNLDDTQMAADPRFVGDGTGPRVDPRGPNADGQPLDNVDPLGLASPGGGGYASWYLDDNSVVRGTPDGRPDRNANFGGAFVNAGDPAWFDALDAMLADGIDGVAGMRELLTDSYGRGYDCDGLFLDTIDTAAPNSFTDSTSGNQSEFEWTAPGFGDFMQRLDTRYPDKLVSQNRGLFLFDPRFPHYAGNPRASIDFLLVESYRLNSNSSQGFDPVFFPDNKFNFATKIMAEAGRPDGFRVLSLGYAEGPGIELGTLRGESTTGLTTLQVDILETQILAGFRHYLTDGQVAYANSFVLDQGLPTDVIAPTWTSTYNSNVFAFPTPAGAPVPRIGIQQVVAGPTCAVVRWDVALDQSAVDYALYTSTTGFDFANDPTLSTATRRVLAASVGAGYPLGPSPSVYPFEALITGLTSATTVSFCIRAFDSAGNEDDNQVVMTAVPAPPVMVAIDGLFGDWIDVPVSHADPADAVPSSGPDWLDVRVVDDADNLYIRFGSDDAFNLDGSPGFPFSRTLIFIDVDNDAATGWPLGSIGSDLLVNGTGLFRQTPSTFNSGSLGTIDVLPTTAVIDCELAIPLSQVRAIAPNASTLSLRFLNDETDDFAPNSTHLTHTLSQ